jgi:hypothetical protein
MLGEQGTVNVDLGAGPGCVALAGGHDLAVGGWELGWGLGGRGQRVPGTGAVDAGLAPSPELGCAKFRSAGRPGTVAGIPGHRSFVPERSRFQASCIS